ncbi:MAG: ATP-binding protein [bacterium]
MEDELVISSRTEHLSTVREFIESRLASLHLSEKERANIVFCLIEATINAMHHGNADNPDKLVKITFKAFEKKVVLTVKDQGSGFELAEIGDPREPKRINKPNGRGIFFMRQMLSKVDFRFSQKGTTATLTKNFNGAKK